MEPSLGGHLHQIVSRGSIKKVRAAKMRLLRSLSISYKKGDLGIGRAQPNLLFIAYDTDYRIVICSQCYKKKKDRLVGSCLASILLV